MLSTCMCMYNCTWSVKLGRDLISAQCPVPSVHDGLQSVHRDANHSFTSVLLQGLHYWRT